MPGSDGSPAPITGKNRGAGFGKPTGDRPVVALEPRLQRIVILANRRQRQPLSPAYALLLAQLLGEVVGPEGHASMRQIVARDHARIDQRKIETFRHNEMRRRLEIRESFELIRRQVVQQLRHVHLSAQISGEPEDPNQRRGDAPVTGSRPGNLKLDRQKLGPSTGQVNIRVDAVRERGEDLSALGMIASEFSIEVTAIQEQASRSILTHEALAERLR